MERTDRDALTFDTIEPTIGGGGAGAVDPAILVAPPIDCGFHKLIKTVTGWGVDSLFLTEILTAKVVDDDVDFGHLSLHRRLSPRDTIDPSWAAYQAASLDQLITGPITERIDALRQDWDGVDVSQFL